MVCPYLFPLSCLCLPCCVSCFFLSWFGGLVVCQFVGCVGGLVVCRFAGLLFWWCGGLLVCWGSPSPHPLGGSRLAMRKTCQAKKSPQNSRAATNTFPPVCWFDGLLFWWFACLLVCWFAGVVVCWSWWCAGLLVCWCGGLLVCWFAGLSGWWLCLCLPFCVSCFFCFRVWWFAGSLCLSFSVPFVLPAPSLLRFPLFCVSGFGGLLVPFVFPYLFPLPCLCLPFCVS